MFWTHLGTGNYKLAAIAFISFMAYKVDTSRENIVTKTVDRRSKKLNTISQNHWKNEKYFLY